MTYSTLNLILLCVIGVILFLMSLWLNLETWRTYKRNCLILEENYRLLAFIRRVQTTETKVLTSKSIRKPSAVFSPTRQKSLAKVIQFNSAKQLKKLLNKKGKGDKK